jgi:hypothetical protein
MARPAAMVKPPGLEKQKAKAKAKARAMQTAKDAMLLEE